MAGEEDLFRALNGAGSNPALDAVALVLDISALLYVIILWAGHLWLVKRRALAYDYLIALFVAVAVTEVLKFAICRPPPADVYTNVTVLPPPLLPDLTEPSIPSGHNSPGLVVASGLGLHQPELVLLLLSD